MYMVNQKPKETASYYLGYKSLIDGCKILEPIFWMNDLQKYDFFFSILEPRKVGFLQKEIPFFAVFDVKYTNMVHWGDFGDWQQKKWSPKKANCKKDAIYFLQKNYCSSFF